MKRQSSKITGLLPKISLGLLVVLAHAALADSGPNHQASQTHPIQLGTSGGNINDRSTFYCCSGTLGALVEDDAGTQYILSNNHVLALGNNGQVGDDVNQPGQVDQNCGQQGVVADLSNWVPIQFSKGRRLKLNEVDAAIAAVRPGAVSIDGSILDIGTVSASTVVAFAGQAVQKSGRTTGHTTGTVDATDVTVDVAYSKECGGAASDVARFVNQVLIRPGTFSGPGDSGSLIVESGANGPRATALLFAGSPDYTLANPIDSVLTSLGVNMVGGGTPPPATDTGTVAGAVTDGSTGGGIAGATVSSDTGESTTTDASGAYSLVVPVGTRTITASASGYQSESQTVAVSKDTTTAANLALDPALSPSKAIVECMTYNTYGGKDGDRHLQITIHVVDDFGEPVSGAAVSIDVTHGGSAFGSATGTTGPDGAAGFDSKNAPNGVYVTTVTAVQSALTFEGSTPANSFNKGTDSAPASFGACATSSSTLAGASPAVKRARLVKARHSETLLDLPDVVGHGIGKANGNGQPVIEVYLGRENGLTRQQIPAALDGVPVRIVVTGPFVAY